MEAILQQGDGADDVVADGGVPVEVDTQLVIKPTIDEQKEAVPVAPQAMPVAPQPVVDEQAEEDDEQDDTPIIPKSKKREAQIEMANLVDDEDDSPAVRVAVCICLMMVRCSG